MKIQGVSILPAIQIRTTTIRSSAPATSSGTLLLILVVRIWMAGRIETPWIFIDELVYGDMARGFREQRAPAHPRHLRRHPDSLYPVAISPAWLVTDATG